jgi:hypothetical protein
MMRIPWSEAGQVRSAPPNQAFQPRFCLRFATAKTRLNLVVRCFSFAMVYAGQEFLVSYTSE